MGASVRDRCAESWHTRPTTSATPTSAAARYRRARSQRDLQTLRPGNRHGEQPYVTFTIDTPDLSAAEEGDVATERATSRPPFLPPGHDLGLDSVVAILRYGDLCQTDVG
jgi:hypothetical protein